MALRLLWVVPDFPWPLNSGNSVAVYNRIKELNKKGHQIYLFSNTRSPVKQESIDAMKEYCEDVKVYQLGASELMRNLFFSPSMPFRIARRFCREMKRDISNSVTSSKIDVILIEHSINVVYFPKEHSKIVKSVVLFQSLTYKSFFREAKHYPSFFSPKKFISYIESFKTKPFEDNIFKSKMFDEYWFYSSDDINDVVSMYPYLKDKIRFIPIGIEKREYSGSEPIPIRGLTPADKMILLIGSMNNPSNEDSARWFAQKIFPKIKSKVPNAKFCVVGTNSSYKLKDIASEDVLIMGEAPDLRPYLHRCDLYVVPQRGGAGVKTKFVDGLSAKKIIVVTPMGVEAIENIEPNVHFLLARDEEEFANKSVEVLKNPQKFMEIAENGFDYFMNNFSVEAVGNLSESYLLDLTNKR